MKSLKNISFTELKSIYDFLEIRKNIHSDNAEKFGKEGIHQIINKQKLIWTELSHRLSNINEFKELNND